VNPLRTTPQDGVDHDSGGRGPTGAGPSRDRALTGPPGPSLISVPSGGAFFQAAGPAFETYQDGEPDEALAVFMSVVCGEEWASCRALLAIVCRARWRGRTRTPTPSSASNCLPWPSGRSVLRRQPPSVVRCCLFSAPRPSPCGLTMRPIFGLNRLLRLEPGGADVVPSQDRATSRVDATPAPACRPRRLRRPERPGGGERVGGTRWPRTGRTRPSHPGG
jgi:hypothetical protein